MYNFGLLSLPKASQKQCRHDLEAYHELPYEFWYEFWCGFGVNFGVNFFPVKFGGMNLFPVFLFVRVRKFASPSGMNFWSKNPYHFHGFFHTHKFFFNRPENTRCAHFFHPNDWH